MLTFFDISVFPLEKLFWECYTVNVANPPPYQTRKQMRIEKFFRTFLLLYIAAICFLTSCGGKTPSVTTASSATAQTSSTTSSTTSVTPPEPKKRVAITFDDGPHNVWTVAIADELAKYGFHATFFVVGNRIGGEKRVYNGSSTALYLFRNGHELGIHGYTHLENYKNCSDAEYQYEMSETVAAIKKFCSGYEATLMRPIGGSISQERIEASPYSIITWNVDSLDYKHKGNDSASEQKENVETIVHNVMSTVKEGDIILMHDIYENTYEALKIILERLDAEGYEVVTITELLGEPLPGTRYSHR